MKREILYERVGPLELGVHNQIGQRLRSLGHRRQRGQQRPELHIEQRRHGCVGMVPELPELDLPPLVQFLVPTRKRREECLGRGRRSPHVRY